MKVNPLTYDSLQTRSGTHDVGEVWASLLWGRLLEVLLPGMDSRQICTTLTVCRKYCYHEDYYGWVDDPTIANPTFLGARDAIVAADVTHYKGANKCDILKHLLSVGLGSKATDTRKNDFSVPPECDGNAPPPRATTTDITTRATTGKATTTTKKVGTTTKKAGTTPT
ncbi:hypothetical protein BASA81_011604 [Batrachochytrium salamandrivorans]|nr:hypothetical protein BASA81_011604 [Batrachochytrium salamandrivorans]